jgi:hypothetical protein
MRIGRRMMDGCATHGALVKRPTVRAIGKFSGVLGELWKTSDGEVLLVRI